MIRICLVVCACLLLVATALAQTKTKPGLVRVLMQTELGDIEIELEAKRAPGTTENFLRYVDAGYYDGGRFHRTVKLNPDNQPNNTIKIEVIQGGVNPEKSKQGFAPI